MDNKDDTLLEEFNKLLMEDEGESRAVYLIKEIKTQRQLALNAPKEGDQLALIIFYDTFLNYLHKKVG